MLSMGGIGNAIVIQKMCHTWIFFVWDAACTYTEHRINQWILVRIKKNCHWCVRTSKVRIYFFYSCTSGESNSRKLFLISVFCFLFFSIDWIIAGLAAIPYFLFTTLNYLDYPTNSGNYLQDSAFCAMLKTPKVSIWIKTQPCQKIAHYKWFYSAFTSWV